jgi:hypothetical protein
MLAVTLLAPGERFADQDVAAMGRGLLMTHSHAQKRKVP